jgi:hypothetical protein
MAVFKAPRITTTQRLSLILEESEIVYDVNEKKPYYGDGVTVGGVEYTNGASQVKFFNTGLFSPTTQQILDKKILLSYIPLENSVSFNFSNGIPQFESIDFYIDQNFIRWDNLGLDGFIEETDLIQISYAYL